MSPQVLVADDSGTMRKIIIRSLNSVGIDSVIEAGDGDQAIALFHQHRPDIILTDWNMPGKTGIEVLRHIREEDKEVPVLLITTEAEKSRVLEAVQAGVSGYLVKPFQREALCEKLGKLLGASYA